MFIPRDTFTYQSQRTQTTTQGKAAAILEAAFSLAGVFFQCGVCEKKQ